ncbi:MAG TPA: hypothetical protein VMV41_01200 [Cellulomonadaceae bacterium]|nr:hypothetical protein [Cellulomonadaceae bacterium]
MSSTESAETYAVVLNGCDDTITVLVDLTPTTYIFLTNLAAGLTGVRASGCQPGMTVRRVTAHDHMNAQNDVERRADYGPYNPEGIES